MGAWLIMMAMGAAVLWLVGKFLWGFVQFVKGSDR